MAPPSPFTSRPACLGTSLLFALLVYRCTAPTCSLSSLHSGFSHVPLYPFHRSFLPSPLTPSFTIVPWRFRGLPLRRRLSCKSRPP
ncbi:hypothetical protein KC19_VG335100 [Ceratodon purpureus]|uniref:Secreted protein n=1 Tax=Ceratodon purpureus TaxID=3225 RepID=A0A8T0HWR7_CERPU|nr:hypothetical protein KC19_VG335100 [Ceratodon purpureus]